MSVYLSCGFRLTRVGVARLLESLEKVADGIASRIAELLGARVLVVDNAGALLADQKPSANKQPACQWCSNIGTPYITVPVQLNENPVDVIVAHICGEEVVSPRVAQVLVELMVGQQTASAHLRGQYDLKNKFIFDLLMGTGRDASEISKEAQILGIDLSERRSVILIGASDYILAPAISASRVAGEDRIRQRAQLVIDTVTSFFAPTGSVLCAYLGGGHVVVLKAIDSFEAARDGQNEGQTVQLWANLGVAKKAAAALLSRLCGDTRARVSIAVGRYHPGIAGLASSYQDALAALNM